MDCPKAWKFQRYRLPKNKLIKKINLYLNNNDRHYEGEEGVTDGNTFLLSDIMSG
jgi:hypothetical protein